MVKIASVNKEQFKKEVAANVKMLYRKTLDEATPQQIYQAVSYAIKDDIIDRWIATHKVYKKQNVKKVYYLSMEFLMGRQLGNNLINLGYYNEIKKALDEMGFDLNFIEDQERDPALGNGGLGRLAACFLDSLSTLGYPAYGCGIRYRYGMFKQAIVNGAQVEEPDEWLKNGYPFEVKRAEYACDVKFGGYVRVENRDGRNHFIQEGYQSVRAVPYDMPIVGYGNNVVNTLRMWDAEAPQEFNLNSFDRGEYEKAVEQANLARTICEVLYPNDNHLSGKELRLKQQYFFVSASLQTAIKKFKENNKKIADLPKKVTFQMNDTHPTLTVPELMRILMDEEGLEWDEAWEITTKTCAYTNHTIMSEALEKWPIELFSRLLPRIYQIVEEINRRFVQKIEETYPGDQSKVKSMAILYDGQVKMAHLAIAGSYSVNGVARLHTEILKKRELKDFYEMNPKQFNNKTNGITQRRFVVHGNPLLANWLDSKIGNEWVTDLSQLSKLKTFVDDKKYQQEFMNIKYQNKVRLAKYIKEHNGIDVDPTSIFDVQVKRLHEYKRQLLNILHVMHLYTELKENPQFDMYPTTFIFGAKAAAGYKRAKLTIELINDVANVINNDASIGNKIKVVFIEDYRVSNGEIIFAAADVSEQISTASREASGTGNMKFMVNGALTLGTMDGANVEIVEEVGIDNAFIFGLSANEVMKYEKEGGYNPWDIFNNTKEDVYFILKDFDSYAEAHRRVDAAYRDEKAWAKMAMLNTASAGKFSSDRTIEEYVKDIWKLKKVEVELEEEPAKKKKK